MLSTSTKPLQSNSIVVGPIFQHVLGWHIGFGSASSAFRRIWPTEAVWRSCTAHFSSSAARPNVAFDQGQIYHGAKRSMVQSHPASPKTLGLWKYDRPYNTMICSLANPAVLLRSRRSVMSGRPNIQLLYWGAGGPPAPAHVMIGETYSIFIWFIDERETPMA